MRGYFGIGVEGISKASNLGAVTRTAHAFGASFIFSVSKSINLNQVGSVDTSNATKNMPFYAFDSPEDLLLPKGCKLVGVELTDEAIELPSFHHPRCAAYILGPERGILSSPMLQCCDHIVRIPTKFSINVGLAGALVMYDRLLSMGRFAPRPQRPGGPTEPMPLPVFGSPAWVRKKTKIPRTIPKNKV
ncbi:MAG: rRNA methyltransferase [Rhodospirillaceae bacterium]|nr:rRNA methyltransferase [Rhodospirillaceae bacterium]|tara:strand:- start:2740 stop:3306 length:567 start_codon:yes stop_codon:yes gene_type:complete